MNSFKTILAAVDFSSGSRSALDEACRLARQQGAALHVLHVVDSMAVAALRDSHGGNFERQAESSSHGASAALARWLEQSERPADIHASVSMGNPAHEILEHVRSLHADVLVVGTSGAGGMQTGAGSVAGKLARKSPCSILLVSPHAPLAYRKVVAAVDFSDSAKLAAGLARDIAVGEAGHVDFVHVWQEPWLVMSYDAPVSDSTTHLRDSYIRDLNETLTEFVEDAAAGIQHQEVLINAPNHGRALADYGREHKADLIVIGDKGRTNLQYVLLGSTAERLLVNLPCSLLVVKPPRV